LTTESPRSAPNTDDTPSAATAAAHFAGLTPDVVLDALSAIGLEGDGRLTQLNSFENRVFQVMLQDGSAVVTKFYRPERWSDEQIAEEHDFSLEAQAAEVPVVAPLALANPPDGGPVRLSQAAPRTLAHWHSPAGHWRFAVWPRRAGRTPELEDEQVLQRLGSSLALLHRVGQQRRFVHRHTLDPLVDARAAVQTLLEGEHLPPDQLSPWAATCEAVLRRIEAASVGVAAASLRLHGDCHPGNLLWRDDRPNLVDLDDACNGPAVHDLWMLLSGDPDEAARQLQALLAGYERVRPFDRKELPLIAPLRLYRLLRHNAWIARRWADPAFPLAYPHFGSSSYWAQQSLQLRELLNSADD
jgi:Ser/Thr protein kinase RdoA (MazF antagonist)